MQKSGICALLILLILALISCRESSGGEDRLPEDLDQNIFRMAQGYLSALPELDIESLTPEKKKMIELGKKLFYDKNLSEHGEVSCATCHDISTYGTKNEAIIAGNNNATGTRNPPTVLNAHLQYALNWDAQFKTLEEQAMDMLFSETEMGITDSVEVLNRLHFDPEYMRLFADAFPDKESPISFSSISKAIAAFERTLLTPSRFDDYIKGDLSALKNSEKLGLKSFIERACAPCHSTALLGGSMSQKFALFGYYWDYTNSTSRDKGRFELTQDPADMYVFKVSQLRNIEKTYPYMHDGSVESLEESVRIMAMSESNMQLSDEEVENISAFLRALTGKIPEHAIEGNPVFK
jgi:cytochrome c peroxidase